jgi:biopolymer transport protein ExbD
MSVKRHNKTSDEAELDLTPMLDVVFIMLIFFIVTTSFVKASGIEINTPIASTAEEKNNTTIFVAISAAGNVWIDGREVEVRTVKSIIGRMHAQNPEGAVVVQSDKKASTEHLLAVMDQIRSAGVKNIAVAAKKP